MRRSLAVCGFIALSWFARPASALDSNCWLGGLKWQLQTVEVYLNDSLGAVADCDGEPITSFQTLGATTGQMSRVVQMSVARWNDAGAPLRLVYAGATNSGCIPGAIVIGVIPNGCSSRQATALSYDTDSDGFYDRGNVLYFHKDATCNTAYAISPAHVFLMTHELGHTLGRNDAYTGTLCGNTHGSSIMTAFYGQGLTGFDKQEHQSIYRSHTQPSRLVARSLTTSWGPATVAGTDVNTSFIGGPGLGASSNASSLRVPVLDDTDMFNAGGERERAIAFTHAGVWDTAWFQDTLAPPKRHSVALAIAANGSALQAYAYHPNEDLEPWQICYQKSTDGAVSFGAPTCVTGSFPGTYKVSATFDPLSGRYLIVWTTPTRIEIISTPRPGVSGSNYTVSVSAHNLDGASITCADTQPIDAPLYSNCRVVFIDTNTYAFNVRWFELGADSLGIYVGTMYTDLFLTSEYAPAVAWRGNQFHLTPILNTKDIFHYTKSRTGTWWNYSATLNSTGWISPAMLSPTKSGSTTKLHAFWLDYETFP